MDDLGFVTEIVENGNLAFEKMKNNRYDIILIDLQMPDMNSFEATDYLRNTLKSSVPIMALTDSVTTKDVINTSKRG